MVNIRRYAGAQVLPFLKDLAELRIEVFREYPYLYDGSLSYEEGYLETYARAKDSVFVIVHDGDQVVGASTGVPMVEETEAFKAPFLTHGWNPDQIFYFGESLLLKPFRGHGMGVRFFEERERFARDRGGFEWTAFCAVDRAVDHPMRPVDYYPLNAFWGRRGYTQRPDLVTEFSWKEVGEDHESPKKMVFWTRPLR